jgi:RimJ/RimL family protein N-acetyltransferase
MSKNDIYRIGYIYFREIEKKDIEILRRMHNDPTTLSMLTDPTYITKNMQLNWFKSLHKSNKSKRYSLCTNSDGKKTLLGMIRFDQIDHLNKNMMVGLDIIPALRGKGFGKMGYYLILNYCFNELKMHKVTLYTAAYNDIAKSLYNKLGFKVEGLLKEHLIKGDKYSDLIVMSLFRRDFLKNDS